MVDQTEFEMYTPAGNLACRRLATRMVKSTIKLDTRPKLTKFFNDELNKVAEKHGEIWDTEPRCHLARFAETIGEMHGFEFDY